ncbi:DUF3221 domain-containing protein [Paenibacillus sp. UMB4589-SE434]|uniref:DUF3221 domain-containing protein n=1 Tax=Paenibacillus sp. UMB4589-SE434 TaxID=3046314 RepID=UPI00254DB17F|nr:DUF3221 domain-containing protein [Paenibacillus sp. UMB4589-SE434]MDK8180797.1 DUF3221 domain-containing protein [Paenibacillus sp. UMB4589-SE434]
MSFGLKCMLRISLFISLITISTAGCLWPESRAVSVDDKPCQFNGYIVTHQVKEEQVLFVWGNIRAQDLEDKSVQQLIQLVKPNALWVDIRSIPQSFSPGDKVHLWISERDEIAYPGTAKAIRLEIINGSK